VARVNASVVMTTSKLIHAHYAGAKRVDDHQGAYKTMAAAAMQALAPLVQSAKDHKVFSKALANMASGRKKGLLKSLLGGASKVAGAFGFANQAQYVRTGGKGKKANRGSGGGGRGPGSNLPGGVTVQAGNAPIQFARTDEITNFFRFYPTKNGCMVHAAVQVLQIAQRWDTEAGGFLAAQNLLINPALPDYPWLSTFSALWKKFRVKNLRLHYQHFASTEVPGELIMKYTPDPDDVLLGQPEDQVCNGSNFQRGALYEDFMMECDVSGATKVPLDTDFTDSTDKNDTCFGQIAFFGNHFTGPTVVTDATSTLPGNLYVEMIVEYNDRFVPAADLALVRAVMRSQVHSREQKLEALGVLADREEEAMRRKKAEVKRVDPVSELLARSAAAQPILPSKGLRVQRETAR
jgi:hypothetical protein